ncbi:hypothetical protein BaRGS_00005591, partial [Batillaria attramentaria]
YDKLRQSPKQSESAKRRYSHIPFTNEEIADDTAVSVKTADTAVSHSPNQIGNSENERAAGFTEGQNRALTDGTPLQPFDVTVPEVPEVVGIGDNDWEERVLTAQILVVQGHYHVPRLTAEIQQEDVNRKPADTSSPVVQ